MDFGAWEGRAWSDIARPEFDTWIQDFANIPAGGQGALWVTPAGVIRAAGLVHAGVRGIDSADQWPTGAIVFGELVLLEP